MKTFLSALIVLMLATVSFGQFQPPTLPTLIGVDTITSTIIAQPSATTPLIAHYSVSSGLDPVIGITGPAFSSYHLLVELGPAVPFAGVLPGGIVNVTSLNGYVGYSSFFPLNAPPGTCVFDATGCGIELLTLPLQSMSLPVGTVFALQSIVFNQVYPAGYGFSNPVEYTVVP